jgi:hypothetical protein
MASTNEVHMKALLLALSMTLSLSSFASYNVKDHCKAALQETELNQAQIERVCSWNINQTFINCALELDTTALTSVQSVNICARSQSPAFVSCTMKLNDMRVPSVAAAAFCEKNNSASYISCVDELVSSVSSPALAANICLVDENN